MDQNLTKKYGLMTQKDLDRNKFYAGKQKKWTVFLPTKINFIINQHPCQ